MTRRRSDLAFVLAALLGVAGLLSGAAVHASSGPAAAPKSIRIMVIGDSITEGEEGDFTWRYRLWQHLRADHADVDFVGPKTGAYSMYYFDEPAERDSAPYRVAGWDSAHDSGWGLQLHQAKDTVAADVRTYRADVLLVELGSDDLQQRVTDAPGFVADMKALVAAARSANPHVSLLIGTLPPRSDVTAALPFLAGVTDQANTLLAGQIPPLSTAESPVRLVDLDSGRDPSLDTHDGIHPNPLGEYRIAAAFASALGAEGIGSPELSVPEQIPGPDLIAPSLTVKTLDSSGVLLRWSQVQTADAYWVYKADLTAGQSLVRQNFPLTADHWFDSAGAFTLPGHAYQYVVAARYGDAIGQQSAPVTVTVPGP